MDSEAFNRHPNRTKSRKRAQDYSNLTIPILPAELITEILSRLPVKSLLKFRCVSKSWLALISSPKFIKTHLSLSANKKEDTHHMLILDPGVDKWNFKECLLRSLYEDSVIEVFDLNYPFENSGSYISILGSCNGLIFVVHYSECSLLWNPTTKKYKTLPDFRPIYGNIYGFGYDELHDDYKVVDISCKYNNEGSGDMEVKIYSLKSDSWTSVDCCGGILNGSSSCRKMVLNGSSSCRKMVLNGSGLFANGKLHWETIVVGPNFSTARKGTNIISFDLANEKWEKMEQPSYGVGETDLCMGTFGSGLCVFSYYKGTHFSAWVMKEYGVKESWMKMFTIRYPNDRNLHLPPFFMPNKGEILGVFGSTFMIYNSKDDLLRYPDVINYDICHDRTIYIESLVCPFSTEGTENTTKGRLKKHKPKRSSNE